MVKDKQNYTYERVMLYIYPHFEWLIEQGKRRVCNRAILSYKNNEEIEKLVVRLLDESMHCDMLNFGRAAVKNALEQLDPFEKELLQYRYRHKEGDIEQAVKEQEVSRRTIYRRLESAMKNFSCALKRNGVDEQWFTENILCYEWGTSVFRKVMAKQDSNPMPRRGKKSPIYNCSAEKRVME